MFKSSKKNILVFKHKKNIPLLSSNSRGGTHEQKIKKMKEKIIIKKIEDINGMEISYNVVAKKN